MSERRGRRARRSPRWGARAALVATMGLSVGGCIEPNPDHCAFAYGDASCPEERPYCVVASEPRTHEGVVNGCFAPREAWMQDESLYDGFIGVPYGLPTTIEARAGRPRDPRAMQVILIEQGYPQECFASTVLGDRFDSLLRDVKRVRRHLEKRDQHRRSRLEISDPLVNRLHDFRSEVDGWLVECIELAVGTGETTGSATDDTSTDISSSGSSSGGGGCFSDADCLDPFAPYCDPATALCVPCSALPDPHGSCASVDPLQPICVGASCVECADGETQACDDQLLVCDPTTNTCVPCNEHEQCEAGACDLLLDVPTCFEPQNVLDVGLGQPYPSITGALNAVDSQQLERAVLRLRGTTYDESVSIGSQAIAFVSADGSLPMWQGSGGLGDATLAVSDTNARVYLSHVSIYNPTTSAPGISCFGGGLDIRRGSITTSPGGDITAFGGCELHVRNSFLGGNASDVDVITITDASLDMTYTTVSAGLGFARALYCAGDSAVAVRNSILVSRSGDELYCPGGLFTDNATNGDSSGGNIPVGGWTSAWFSSFSVGDFHLTSAGASDFMNIASWQTTDPWLDIDGDPRPFVAGTPDYPGADAP